MLFHPTAVATCCSIKQFTNTERFTKYGRPSYQHFYGAVIKTSVSLSTFIHFIHGVGLGTADVCGVDVTCFEGKTTQGDSFGVGTLCVVKQ